MYLCSNLIISAPLKPEGFGRIISEALAMRKIVLAYNFGGAKDQLDHLDDIYKVKPFDTTELINKINEVLKLDENSIKTLGSKARDHVTKHFSNNSMLKSYFNYYKEL